MLQPIRESRNGGPLRSSYAGRIAAMAGMAMALGISGAWRGAGRGVSIEGQRGINIEGLAVREGRLYFGLRGPAQNGEAMVVSVNADAFFAGVDAAPEVARIAVGDRRGIRDMAAVRDGFLLLAGPDDDTASTGAGWTLSFWDGKGGNGGNGEVAKPRPLAALDLSGVKLSACDKEVKPEAIAVMEEAAQHYDVVVLSDGMCDGGPLSFRIIR